MCEWFTLTPALSHRGRGGLSDEGRGGGCLNRRLRGSACFVFLWVPAYAGKTGWCAGIVQLSQMGYDAPRE